MQARIYILGFVQGVGLRRFVKKNAVSFGIKGYIKNLPDGRVEVVANGKKEEIAKLVKIIEKGSLFSDVKSVAIEWEKEEEFSDFQILR